MQSSTYLIAVGVILILVALLRRTTSKGNFFSGINTGRSVQNYKESAPPAPQPPDKVLWIITIVGIVVTIAGIYMAHYDAVIH
jgi:hypothetical protein